MREDLVQNDFLAALGAMTYFLFCASHKRKSEKLKNWHFSSRCRIFHLRRLPTNFISILITISNVLRK